jgi:integrase/recombinase XerC
MSVSQYPQIEQFLHYLRFEKRYSGYTVISYENDLQQFFAFLTSQFDAPPVAQITPSFIRSWLAELKEDAIGTRSINRKISSLKSFFKFMVKQGVVQQTPMTVITGPKTSKRLPAFVADTDMARLLESDGVGQFFDNSPEGGMQRLIILLFYSTGIRLAELVYLQVHILDAANCLLKVLG